MKTRLFSLSIFLFFAVPVAAFAHDASMHKGKNTIGEVMSIANDKLVMKTDKGSVPVTLIADTKVELEEGQAVTKGNLKVGDHLMVTGTKLPSGELVAKEIMIDDKNEHGKKSRAGAAVCTCKMHPEATSDKPGKCPKCGMKLVRNE